VLPSRVLGLRGRGHPAGSYCPFWVVAALRGTSVRRPSHAQRPAHGFKPSPRRVRPAGTRRATPLPIGEKGLLNGRERVLDAPLASDRDEPEVRGVSPLPGFYPPLWRGAVRLWQHSPRRSCLSLAPLCVSMSPVPSLFFSCRPLRLCVPAVIPGPLSAGRRRDRRFDARWRPRRSGLRRARAPRYPCVRGGPDRRGGDWWPPRDRG